VKFMFEQGGKFKIFLFGQNFVTWRPKRKGCKSFNVFFCRIFFFLQYLEKEKEKLNLPDLDLSF
jgi:hypothetical protein